MSQNNLYPIFLKPESLQFLIVGGGNVGLEKLTFLLKSSPNAKVNLIGKSIGEGILQLAAQHDHVFLQERSFNQHDLIGVNVLVLATENNSINRSIHKMAKARGVLVNVADTPDLCDFYMGSIVTKGDLKIGISTNGMSPTLAKRMRQMLEEVLPDDLHQLILNLNRYRNSLKGDFQSKVKALNSITKKLIA